MNLGTETTILAVAAKEADTHHQEPESLSWTTILVAASIGLCLAALIIFLLK